MATEGPNSPDSAASLNTVGTVAWSNPTNALASDDSRATAALNPGDQSEYLHVSDFDFTVVDGSTINGIGVEVEKGIVGAGGTVTDTAVRLVKGGSVGGTDRSNGTPWDTESYTSYGGASDLWGETLTPADIRSTNFGFAISATLDGLGPATTIGVDHVRITVHYTTAGGQPARKRMSGVIHAHGTAGKHRPGRVW